MAEKKHKHIGANRNHPTTRAHKDINTQIAHNQVMRLKSVVTVKKDVMKNFLVDIPEIKDLPLGVKLRDKITGFTGIVIARTVFLNGCLQLYLKPTVDKEGKLLDAQPIDSQQLEFVDWGIVKKPCTDKPKEETKSTGGPNINCRISKSGNFII